MMDGLQLQWAIAPQSTDLPGRFRAYADRTLRTHTVAGTGLPDA